MDAKTTVQIEERLMRKIKIYAAENKTTVKGVIHDALYEYFMEEGRESHDREQD